MHRYVLSDRVLFINAQPDLLITTEHENIIIDFKTDRHLTKDMYALQLALYVSAAEGLNNKPCRAFLCFLRSGDMIQSRLKKKETGDFLEKILFKEK